MNLSTNYGFQCLQTNMNNMYFKSISVQGPLYIKNTVYALHAYNNVVGVQQTVTTVIVYQLSSIEQQYSIDTLYALHAYNNIIGLQCMQMTV